MEMVPGSRRRRCLEILCAVLFPPLAFYLRHGRCSVHTRQRYPHPDGHTGRKRLLLSSALLMGQMAFWCRVLRTILAYVFGFVHIMEADPAVGYLHNCLVAACAFILLVHRPDDDGDEEQKQFPPPLPATASAGDSSIHPKEEMGSGSSCRRCLELLCVVLLPPLGVYLRHGCYSMRFWISVLRTILGYFVCILFVIEAPVMVNLHNKLAVLAVLGYPQNKGYLHHSLAILGAFALLGYHPNKDYLHSYLSAVCVFAIFVHYPSNGDNDDVDEEDDPATAASYVSLT